MFPFVPAAPVIFHIPGFSSTQKAADSSRQPAHPPPLSSLFLSLQTYQQSSSLQSKSRKKNKGKPIVSDRAAFTLLPERRCAQRCTAMFRQSDGMLLSYVSMETNNDFLKNVYHSLRSPSYPKATNVPSSRFSCSRRDVFSPSLSSSQLPDVTFCPSVTEAFFSSRRSDEDQHAGRRPFRSFHHLPLRGKLREAQKILGSICTFVSRRIGWFARQQSEFARESENNNLFIIYQA